ncbi:MAG: isoleucine--tRNA ligase, partial [Clostridiales bacterium]|nr:isoleucine--tRNA ligase [Clostridiales bacterium]
GLPVELEVEKNLGFSDKSQIEEFGLINFNAECRKSVFKYVEEWQNMSKRIGFWLDFENRYATLDENYIESVWWSLKEIYNKGLLYLGYKVVPYCPRCGTPLSSHEVGQGMMETTDPSIHVKFRSLDFEDTYYLAWTTTPWTLPSNQALCVNADVEYVKCKSGENIYILAKDLAPSLLDECYAVVETMKGSALVGMQYDNLFPKAHATPEGQIHQVVADPYVTTSDGSGIVHLAPFGEDDMRILKREEKAFNLIVDPQGRFTENTPWPKTFVKDADENIIKQLEKRGQLHEAMDYDHSYPFCWRCDTPLLYYPRDSWFIAMSQLRSELVKNNRSINWMPDNIKEGRMGKWMENVIDWGISRERYWGTPLPVWLCECGHMEVIGSMTELKEKGIDVPEDIELHKPYIDEIKMKCKVCSRIMTRETSVIDCWYDAGSMPFAQWHYPFENKLIFEQNFPANFISEAVDQTRGWFYTLIAISTILFDESPFRNCIVLGHVQDKEGKKMSKHLGNVTDPWEVLDKQGADAVRWYFYINSQPWLPSRYADDAVSEGQRKFMGTLWNTYAFYVLYANIDGFDPTQYELEYEKLSVMDQWMLSRLNTLTKDVDEHLENYRITEAGRALASFVDELSNWYVRRGRERYWGSDMDQDKINAYMTLHKVLVDVCKLAAPFIPFLTEQIYQNLVCSVDKNAHESIHLCEYPSYDESKIDTKLEENMDAVLKVVSLARACRNYAAVKNRQPLSQLYIQGVKMTDDFSELVLDELNVKNMVYTDDASSFIDYIIKPQMRTLGPKYGKLLNEIKHVLAEVNGTEFVQTLNEKGVVHFNIKGTEVTLSSDDVLISTTQKEGFVSQSENEVTVVLDTNLTPELVEEGTVREIISKVQTMRKEAGFEVTDHIVLSYDGYNEVFAKQKELIGVETLADKVEQGSEGSYQKTWDINNVELTLAVTKI